MRFPSLKLGDYRFAPALWPSVAFVLLFPCLLALGYWQMDRAKAKQEILEQSASGDAAEVIDLRDTEQLVDADRYRSALVEGRYLDDQQWLLDNRIYHGQAGYHVFTPFIIDGDRVPKLLINRGWIGVGETREYLPVLPVPEGRVRLHGRLDSPASVALVLGEVPLDSVESRVRLQALDIEALGIARNLPLLRYALVLDEGQPGSLQYDWSPIPPMGPEKHLGYAIQWFGLAIALLIIYVGVNTHRNGSGGNDHVSA